MQLMLTLAVILSAAFCNPIPPACTHTQPTQYSANYDSTSSLSWTQYKQKYGKHYASFAEEHYRSHIFARGMRRMAYHNANPNRTFDMYPNSFLDVDERQFQEVFTSAYPSGEQSWNFSRELIRRNGRKRKERHFQAPQNGQNLSLGTLAMEGEAAGSDLALSHKSGRILAMSEEIEIDWSLVSGKVRFQGTCGACYAFTAVQTFAATYSMRLGFFVPLSIQQVIDCADNGLTFGCKGGYMEGAYTYLQTNGVVLQSQYPYVSQNSSRAGKCQQKGGPFKLSSFRPIEEGNCNAIIQQLRRGPVSVGISGYGLQYYGRGVFDECSDRLDHAVMVVGYRSGVGWRIKNSWGSDWGENGYGWIAEGNTCGICNMAFSINI